MTLLVLDLKSRTLYSAILQVIDFTYSDQPAYSARCPSYPRLRLQES